MMLTQRSSRRNLIKQRSNLKPKRMLGQCDIASIAFTGLEYGRTIEQYKKWSTDMGLTVLDDVKDYDEKTVMVAGQCCSSVKLMVALSTTKHIVSEQWIKDCQDVNKLVSTSQYVTDHKTAIENGERIRATGDFLLSGMSVHSVIRKKCTANIPSHEQLRILVERAGGRWVSTQKKASNVDASSLFILIDENDCDKVDPSHHIQLLIDKGARQICWGDLKDCFLNQSIAFNSNAITDEFFKPKTRAKKIKEKFGLLLSPRTRQEMAKPEEARSHRGPFFVPDETKPSAQDDITDDNTLVFNTELKYFNRNLSTSCGAQDRGEIGDGIMNIIKSTKTRLLSVQVFGTDGLKFRAEVPADFIGFFGNAGRENILGWDAYDTSGNIKSQGIGAPKGKRAHVRRFYFHFHSREHLTCTLFVLFGGDDNARKLVEEFFDGNGRFCPAEEPALPHRVFQKDDMDIDFDGQDRPIAPPSRLHFDNDPQELSQLF